MSSTLWNEGWFVSIVNHLWQSTLVVLLTLLLTWVLKRNQARTRYWVWMVASAKLLVPFSLFVAIGEWLRPAAALPAQRPQFASAIMNIAQPFSANSQNIEPVTVHLPESAIAASTSHHIHLLPALFLTVWLCGFLFLLVRWARNWWTIRATVRSASPMPLSTEVPVLSSSLLLEPGVFGIFRPVLLLPEKILNRLSAPQLRSIVAHEMCHVRRRDNLTAAIHMAVEALFWFYPPVWWIGARLVDERERACDEAVLQLGNEAEVYAQSILNVCKFYTESPMACMSGVTGSDLKRRIVRIMTEQVAHKLDLSRKLLLSAVGIAAISVPMVFGLLHITEVRAQSAPAQGTGATPVKPMAADAHPSFEVATIKPHDPNSHHRGFNAVGDRFTIRNESVTSLMMFAYSINKRQIVDAPDWVGDAPYDIEGTIDTPGEPNLRQMQEMLQKLLADRFQFKFHREKRELPVYAIQIEKGGPKLKPAAKPDAQPDQGGGNGHGTEQTITYTSATMADFAFGEQFFFDRPVVDQTGLTGRYDFSLRYTYDEVKSTDPNAPPGLFTAVKEQLGLKFQPTKAPVDVFVIDHIERPSVDGAEASAPQSAPANPASPIAATWQGILHTSRDLRFVVKITKAGDGTLRATFYNLDAAPGGIPAISTTLNGSLLKLELPFAAYEGTLSADGNSIIGTWRQGQNPLPLNFARTTKETEWTIPQPPPRLAPMAADANPTFEVATIKPADPDDRNQGFRLNGHRISIENNTMTSLICFAYSIQKSQIVNAPQWFNEQHWNIDGVPDMEGAPNWHQYRRMLQKLLSTRFGLVMHHDKRELSVYSIAVAKGGPKLKRSESDPDALSDQSGHGIGPAQYMKFTNDSLTDFAQTMELMVDRPVVDQTNLSGRYDFTLLWTPDSLRATPTDAAPGLFTAVQEQLGLKLVSTKAPVDVLVIDHVERPSPN